VRIVGVIMYDQALFDRIMSRCVEQAGPLDTACIVWTGVIGKFGYGKTKIHCKHFSVHRAVFYALHGPIQKGICVLHSCDVRACCNPLHLRAGTQQENVHDAMKKGRRARCDGHHNSQCKLTLYQVQEIRQCYVPRRVTYKTLAKLYGVTTGTIKEIVRKRTWQRSD
jgi:hypothetical protein